MIRRSSARTSSEPAPAPATGNPGASGRREWSDEERAAWRRRREERRAKQRAQNIVRAAQMHEARLNDVKEDVPQPVAVVKSLPSAFVGCSGWYYWHWRECFYPPTIPGA